MFLENKTEFLVEKFNKVSEGWTVIDCFKTPKEAEKFYSDHKKSFRVGPADLRILKVTTTREIIR